VLCAVVVVVGGGVLCVCVCVCVVMKRILCVCLTVTSLLFKPDARIMIVYVFAFQRLCMSVTCCCSLCFVCRLSVLAAMCCVFMFVSVLHVLCGFAPADPCVLFVVLRLQLYNNKVCGCVCCVLCAVPRGVVRRMFVLLYSDVLLTPHNLG